MNEPTVEELQNELQMRDMKIIALLDDITETRNKNADLRVEVTVISKMYEKAQKELDAKEAQVPNEGS